MCSSSKHGKVSWNSSNPKVLDFVEEAGEDGKPLSFYDTATGQSNAPMVFMNASFAYADLKSMGSMAPGFLYKADGGYLGTFAFMTPGSSARLQNRMLSIHPRLCRLIYPNGIFISAINSRHSLFSAPQKNLTSITGRIIMFL